MAPITSIAVATLTSILSTTGVAASTFLHARSAEETREMIERTLLAELSLDAARLLPYEDDLRHMYTALPKNEHGLLESTAVRYALHRYFVHKYGRYVKGLEPQGQGWNSSAPTDITSSRVPTYIQGLFEKRLGGRGMGLHDLAVFAATLSDFVNNEVVADIMDLYKAFGISSTAPAAQIEVDRVVTAYAMQLLMNTTVDSVSRLMEEEQALIEGYPSWEDFKDWIQDVRQTAALKRSRSSLVVANTGLESVLEEVIELSNNLGPFQDIGCKSIKASLTETELGDSGRVLLSDFYKTGLTGKQLFVEPTDYLRKLGALDESDPAHPSIIIANYMNSPANCLAFAGMHAVCCIDECESLMAHLERAIAAPAAPPQRILQLVSNLRSDTVDAPRNLTASQVSRLGEIADHHQGSVPLHGRLFAQWMHHVYPRECSFPHTAGRYSPQSPDEYMEEMDLDIIVADENLRRDHIKATRPSGDMPLPWLAVEELVVSHKHGTAQKKGGSILRKLGAFVAALAVAVPAARLSMAAFTQSKDVSDKIHCV